MKKIVYIIFSLITGITFAQKNLLTNGNFELEKIGWQDDSNILSLSPYMKKSGGTGGSINLYVNTEWKGISQEFKIPKNTFAIEVSAWVKTDAVEKGKNSWNKASISIDLGGNYTNLVEQDGTTEWTKVNKVIPTEQYRGGRILIALSECAGSFFFDDIFIKPLTEVEYKEFKNKDIQAYQEQFFKDQEMIFKIKNGDFENGLQNWTGTAEATSEIKHQGKQSIKLSSTKNVWTGIDQLVDLQPGAKNLDLSVWVKAENIKKGEFDWNKGVLIVEFTSDGSTKTSEDQPIFIIDGTQEWQNFKKNLKIPEGTKKYRIMIALSNATGSMYVDELTTTVE